MPSTPSAANWRTYYELTKPGLIYGNLFTTLAAYLFASQWALLWPKFPATLFGMAFVIASGCVFNNYLDRGIDAKMERTKQRALVTGAISPQHALIFGAILGVVGLSLLYFLVNPLTAGVSVFGFVVYVAAYGWAKRKAWWGVIVGSFAGAVPIVVGYTAVVGRFDLAALTLFIILAVWQIPHFYSIAVYRATDYAEAGIPTFVAVRGAERAKVSIALYIILYIVALVHIPLVSKADYTYLALALVPSFLWFGRALQGFSVHGSPGTELWARSSFRYSLIALMGFSFAIALGPLLP